MIGGAVLFDFGNVLVRWDPRTLYRTLFADPVEMERFLAEVCTLDWHLQHDSGVPMAESVAVLVAKHPRYAAEIRAWDERFADMIDGEIEGAAALIDALRAQGRKIGVLTNMPADHAWTCLKTYVRWDQFDTVVVTGFLKTAKPGAHAFRIALAALDCGPGEVFFTDDSPRNVEAARGLGLHAHLFTGMDDLANALRAGGFLT